MCMGLPQVLTSDNGGEFVNKLNDELMKVLGIRSRLGKVRPNKSPTQSSFALTATSQRRYQAKQRSPRRSSLGLTVAL